MKTGLKKGLKVYENAHSIPDAHSKPEQMASNVAASRLVCITSGCMCVDVTVYGWVLRISYDYTTVWSFDSVKSMDVGKNKV